MISHSNKARICGPCCYGADDGAKNALALLMSAVHRELLIGTLADIANALPEATLGLVEVRAADAIGRRWRA